MFYLTLFKNIEKPSLVENVLVFFFDQKNSN